MKPRGIMQAFGGWISLAFLGGLGSLAFLGGLGSFPLGSGTSGFLLCLIKYDPYAGSARVFSHSWRMAGLDIIKAFLV